MSVINTALLGARTFFKGINLTALFYKLAIYVALGVLLVTVSYREGKSNCEKSALSSQISILEERITTERTTIIKELDRRQAVLIKRLETITINSREAAKLKQELAVIRGDLHEAINQRPANEFCAPTRNELRLYEELAKRTRLPTK